MSKNRASSVNTQRAITSVKTMTLVLWGCLMLAGCSQESGRQGEPIGSAGGHGEGAALRIISLSPHLTENAFFAGVGDALVAVDTYSDFPEAAKDLPKIGNAFALNKEAFIALKPTHVLAWQDGFPPALARFIKQQQVEVIVDNADSFADIRQNLQALTALRGRGDTAVSPVQKFDQQLAQLMQRYAPHVSDKQANAVQLNQPVAPKTALFLSWTKPLIILGGKQIVSESLVVCGMKNLYDDINKESAQVSLEDVIKRQPDVIIGSFSADKLPTALKKFPYMRLQDKRLLRPSVHILEATQSLCEQLASQ